VVHVDQQALRQRLLADGDIAPGGRLEALRPPLRSLAPRPVGEHATTRRAQAGRDADQLRATFEQELRAERERFEQELAERDAQAEARRQEADQLVASAAQAQAAMLASFDQARSALIQAAARTRFMPPAGLALVTTLVQPMSVSNTAESTTTIVFIEPPFARRVTRHPPHPRRSGRCR